MKPRPGDLLAGIAGALLIVSLFVGWFDVGDGVATLTAWEAFSITDLVLALAGIGGIVVLVLQGTSRDPAVPVAATVIATAFAGLSLLLVAYRVLNEPGPNDVVDLDAGAWAGLALSALLFYGCGKSMRDESARAATRSIAVEELPVPPATAPEQPDAAPDSPPQPSPS